MDIREAIIRATLELNPIGANMAEIVNAALDSAIAYRAADILGGVNHSIIAAVASAMDEAKPYRDLELESWKADAPVYATQSLAGTERR